MARALPKDWAARHLPVFRVFPDHGVHPPVVLDRPVCVIGRDYDANLALDEPQVSRHHALIVRSRSGVYVRDLASTNGVRRNDKPVRETVLHNNDKLRVGTVLLRCADGFDPSRSDDPRSPARGAASDASGTGARANDPAGESDLDDLMPRLIDSTAGRDASGSAVAWRSGPAPDETDALPAELRVGGKSVAVPAGQRTVLIGRRGDCELRLDAPGIAPVHAVIFELDGARHVRDLNSHTGTSVNGRAVHKAPLKSGDRIEFAGVSVEYVETTSGEAATDATAAAALASDDSAIMPLESSVGIPLAEGSMTPIPVAAAGDSQRVEPPVAVEHKMPTPQPKAEPAANAEPGLAPADVDDLLDSFAEEPPAAPAAPAPVAQSPGASNTVRPQAMADDDDDDEPDAKPAASEADDLLPELETLSERLSAITGETQDAADDTDEAGVDIAGASAAEPIRVSAQDEAVELDGGGDDDDDDAEKSRDELTVVGDRPAATSKAPPAPPPERRPPHAEARDAEKTDPDKPKSAHVITELVEDLAEKANTLKEVWKEHQADGEASRARAESD